MANLGDVLRHYVTYASNLGDANRAEFLEAVDAVYPPPEPEVPAVGTADTVAELAAARARVAELEALAEG